MKEYILLENYIRETLQRFDENDLHEISLKSIMPKTTIEAGALTGILGLLLQLGVQLKDNNELPQNPKKQTAAIAEEFRGNEEIQNKLRSKQEDTRRAFKFLKDKQSQGIEIEDLYDQYQKGNLEINDDYQDVDSGLNQSTLLSDFASSGEDYFKDSSSIDEIENIVNSLGEAIASDQFVALAIDGSNIKDSGNTKIDQLSSKIGDLYSHIESLRKKQTSREQRDLYYNLGKRAKNLSKGTSAASFKLKMLNSESYLEMQEENPDMFERIVNNAVKEIDGDYENMGLGQMIKDAVGLE